MRGLMLLSLLAVFALLDRSAGCPRDKFICNPNECIYSSWICDWHPDCSNKRDEVNCRNGCEIHRFRCSDGTCIANTKVCDRHTDCKDGSDEGNCGTDCFSVEFTCSDGECIAGHHLRCDGKNNCKDGSDEEGCDHARDCTNKEYKCSNDSCIKSDWVCDGEKDCSDGGDEVDCSLPSTCSSQEVTCPNGICASSYMNCIFSLDTATLPTNITALFRSSSNTTESQDNSQQCLLGQGCLVKVMAVVFGALGLLTLIFVGSFCLRYRNKAREDESQYLPLSRQQELSASSEAFTMENAS